MKRFFRKAGLGLLIGASLVLGGGFASADYAQGDNTAGASFDVTYTVQSFRALELSSTADVPFGTVRQGETKGVDGPTLLYGTTWPADQISVYLTDPMANGVVLLVDAGVATEPGDLDVTCIEPGTSLTGVDISETTAGAPAVEESALGAGDGIAAVDPVREPLVTLIDNCGAPGYAGAPGESEVNASSDQWASASTYFTLDATDADQDSSEGAPNLYADMSPTVNFLISAASGG